MNQKFQIADAGNVIVPAYLTLKQKGFAVHWVRSETNVEQETWYAEDATRQFIADDPVALLGLVSIHETRGNEWKASDAEIDTFMSTYDSE